MSVLIKWPPVYLLSEDDPDDADFEPDFSEAEKGTKNKVSLGHFHSLLLFWSSLSLSILNLYIF